MHIMFWIYICSTGKCFFPKHITTTRFIICDVLWESHPQVMNYQKIHLILKLISKGREIFQRSHRRRQRSQPAASPADSHEMPCVSESAQSFCFSQMSLCSSSARVPFCGRAHFPVRSEGERAKERGWGGERLPCEYLFSASLLSGSESLTERCRWLLQDSISA